MKRPVIVAAICLAAAAALGTQTGLLRDIWPVVWLLVIGGALFLGSFHQKLVRVVPYIALAAAACLYVSVYQRLAVQPLQSLVHQNICSVQAVVLDYPELYEENQRVALRITAVNDGTSKKHRAFKVLCYLPFTETALEPGDEIETQVTFYRPDVRDGFERQRYYSANGYFVLASCPDEAKVLHETKEAVWWSYPLRLARQLKESLSRQLPEREAGLLNAILFGDRSGMTDADERNLRKAGLSHMAAVSGMHVGFLAMFFCIAFGRRFGSILSIAAVLIFIPMAGASPSVIRAAIMYILLTISFLRCEDVEALNSLAFALAILLLLNPYAIVSASLLLSFGATLGLLLFSGKLQALLMKPFFSKNKLVRKPAGAIVSVVSCSLSVMVFTTPILLAMFGYVTVLSPLANLLTLSAVGIVFVLGLIVAVCGLFSGFALAAAVEERLLSYVLHVSDWTAHLPFGLLSWGDLIGKTAILGLYLGLFLLFILRKKRAGYRILVPMCVFLLGCSLWSAKETRESTRLTILPSGAGQTMVYSRGPDAVTVIDCGGDQAHDSAEAVVEFLDWNGFEAVHTLILTAVDKSHARYAAKLMETGLVRSIILPKIPKSRRKELYNELLLTAEAYQVHWRAGLPAAVPQGIQLLDTMERKFVAEISLGDREALTIHSLTQNMTAEFLEENAVKADILLLSEHCIDDADQLRAAFDILQPEDIILECGYIDNESLLRRPCHNTKLEGEIVLKEKKGGGVQWQ